MPNSAVEQTAGSHSLAAGCSPRALGIEKMSRLSIRIVLLLTAAVALCACEVQKEFDAQFGDQHFKTAISLIELHRLRFGSYPEGLSELKFTGEWDQIALSSVEYRRVDGGYDLDLIRGWVGTPKLSYPPDFWEGLGLVNSNVKGKR
jgi:hypothetical protein